MKMWKLFLDQLSSRLQMEKSMGTEVLKVLNLILILLQEFGINIWWVIGVFRADQLSIWDTSDNCRGFLVGLSVSESAKLCSYMHFRDPINLEEKSLLQKANLDKAIDFMDTLEEDIPKGRS